MTLGEIKNEIMFQTNNDAEDVEDYLPALVDYINDGYDRVVMVWAKRHIDDSSRDYYPLSDDSDEPNVPGWIHRYLADWATWLVYRNGNPQKQQRGQQYKAAFEEMLSRLADSGGLDGLNEDGTQKQFKHFINIPV